MSDNLKESLSAFIDGEASEIEVHRLLRETDAGGRSWVHFHQVRAVVRGEGALSAARHEALRDRIRMAIAEEESFDEVPAQPRRLDAQAYARPAAAFGLAASLFVAVFVGYNLNQGIDGSGDPGAAAVAGSAQPATGRPAAPIDVQTVANNQNAAREGELELRELDDETLRAVRAYLNQHDRTVRMQPVIYSEPDTK